MRILHLLDEPYDSGIVHYALTAARGLAARGHENMVWGREGCFPIREAARLGLGTAAFTRAWVELPALRRLIRERGIQLLVAHTGSAHTIAALASAERGRRVPLLRVRADARPLRERPMARLLWRRTDAFIAANARILAEHATLFGSLKVRCETIYQGLEDPGPARPPQNGAPTVGVVGRLDPVKGHSDLLKAAAALKGRFPDARYLFVGREENVKAADLKAQARALGLETQVELTGHAPDALELMRRCHVGVVASTGSEAVSRAAVEWMAVGRPLVATAVGCLPEYVEDRVTGRLVQPARPEALAEALGGLLGDVFVRETMGKAGRGRYERLFGLKGFLDATERFYEETLHAVPSR